MKTTEHEGDWCPYIYLQLISSYSFRFGAFTANERVCLSLLNCCLRLTPETMFHSLQSAKKELKHENHRT